MATAKAAPEVTKVLMEDGREVEFVGKRRLNKYPVESTDENGPLAVRFDWRNGATQTFTLPVELYKKFAVHGALQKLGDESSGVDDIEDAVEATAQLMLRLSKGEWTKSSEDGGGKGMAGASILARALVKVTGQTIGQIREFLSAQTSKVKMALRNDPELAPVVRQLEAEKAARAAERAAKEGSTPAAGSSVDTKSLLAGLRPTANE